MEQKEIEKDNKQKDISVLLTRKWFKGVRFKKANQIPFKKANVFHFIWCIIKNWFAKMDDVIFRRGSHIITGLPGAGKTLLMNWVIQNIDPNKYFLISNIKEFEGVPQFEIKDIFDEYEQKKRFPKYDSLGRKCYGIVFDEINLNFNKRLNRKNDYNNLFIGLIEFLVSHRHQGINRVYFIGQKLELQDTQLQSLFKYQHNIVYKKERYRYWNYCLNDSQAFKIPVKLKVDNYAKTICEDGDCYEYLGQTKYKIEPRILLTYNTFALADNYINLPVCELK